MQTTHRVVVFASVIAALGLLMPAFVDAQESGLNSDRPMMPSESMKHDSSMARCPMMRAQTPGPQQALEHRDELGLTADQIRNLESLVTEIRQQRTAGAEKLRALSERLHQATEQGLFDEWAVRESLEGMGKVRAEVRLALLRAAHLTSETLTPDQKTQLSALLDRSGGCRAACR